MLDNLKEKIGVPGAKFRPTYHGNSKPHSLHICGLRRKTFFLVFGIVSLIALICIISGSVALSSRVKRIKKSRSGIGGGITRVRTGVTQSNGHILIPTKTISTAVVQTIGGEVVTLLSEKYEGVTYTFSGSVPPNVIQVQQLRTVFEGGTTSVVEATTFTSNGVTSVRRATTQVRGGATSVATVTQALTVNNIRSNGTKSSIVPAEPNRKVLIFDNQDGGHIVIPATDRPEPFSNPGNKQTFSGDATFYSPSVGLGSCGTQHSDSDLICALSHVLFDAAGVANSNNNPNCGRKIVIRRKGGFKARAFKAVGQYMAFSTSPFANFTTLTSLAIPIRYGTNETESLIPTLSEAQKETKVTTGTADINFGSETSPVNQDQYNIIYNQTNQAHKYQDQKYKHHTGRSEALEKRADEVTVTVVDRCPACKQYDLDLSPAAFDLIGNQDQGRIQIDWRWV